MKPRFVVVLLAFATILSPAWALRYADALYLEDVKDYPPIILTVEKPTTIFSDKFLKGGLLNAMVGEKVKLLAVSDSAYEVTSTKGRFIGWTDPENLTALKPDTLKEIKARIDEDRMYQEAIRKKQVIPGMTPAYVQAALGKPNKITSRKDESGSFEVWSYIVTEPIYETVTIPHVIPLANGRYIDQPSVEQRKVGDREVSSTSIEFKNGRVSAIENTENNDNTISPTLTSNLLDPANRK